MEGENSCCFYDFSALTFCNVALHEVSPAASRPAVRKRLADLGSGRLVLNEHLESQPVRPRHELRERHLARRGVEEAGDKRGRDAIVGCSSEAVVCQLSAAADGNHAGSLKSRRSASASTYGSYRRRASTNHCSASAPARSSSPTPARSARTVDPLGSDVGGASLRGPIYKI
jgi:hypothetical protein